MPPRFSEYEVYDWLRLRPVLHRLKTLRYGSIDRRHRKSPARAGHLVELFSQIKNRRVLVTIAFNDARTISWQTVLIRHFVPDVVYIVADNSADDNRAAEIAKCANDLNVPYVRLPPNPSNSPSRSHGLALNWVWENIIKPGNPHAFGFLDDDIYPTANDDPFASLSEQIFFGVVREGAPISTSSPAFRWFLWAGYAMFLYSGVRNIDLDFSQDWFSGLDTGGGNWEKLYRNFERESLKEQSTEYVGFRDGVIASDAPIQWCGSWLHAVGLMGKPELVAEKTAAIAKILEPHLQAAGHHAS